MSAPAGEIVTLDVGERVRRDDGGVERHEIEIRVPPDLHWFHGHFEGNPVLPAVVQLNEVLRLIRATWPDLDRLRKLTRVKFQSPIRPGDALTLRLCRAPGAQKATFEYSRAGEICSSGRLEFGVPGND